MLGWVNTYVLVLRVLFCIYRRFTGELAKRARHVTATDLIQDFVEENRKTNGSVYSNTTFRTLDAAILDYPSNSFDFVTALWLLQFLTDSQLEEFIAKMVRLVYTCI